jgi:hypothetical protein
MRYRLSTLLILLAILPPLIGLVYVYREKIVEFLIDDIMMRGIP